MYWLNLNSDMSIAFPEQVMWYGPKGIYRSPLLKDAAQIRSILSDIETMKYLRYMTKEPNGWTMQEAEDRIKDQLQDQKDNKKLIVHIICEEKVVGISGLRVIDTENRNAEIGIILDKNYWGKNLATEAFYFSLKWAFNELGLHRVYWTTTDNNVAMRGWTEKVCQLKIESINYEVFNVHGIWLNNYTYALFEDDWRSRVNGILEARIYKK